MIFLVPKWLGSKSAVPPEEFLAAIGEAAKIGRWDDPDRVQIAALKLPDPAKSFYNTCSELHTEDTTGQKFKSVFRERFKDVHIDQYHFRRLQMARQD